MVTERVEVVVSSRGITKVDKQMRGLGRTSNTAAKAIGLVATALAAVVAVRGLTNLARDAIKVSAAFESYGVTLRALLGSQQEANKALENFTTLAAKTPFAVSEIVQGSTALAAATLGNREGLEELTKTAANLAAVTGLSFSDAAGNLARALQGGIGAADLFRERGVRALIESIGGIPDATKLTATELNAAFRDVFGEFGTFGDAAENLSLTLGGALSNIGDASTNFKAALGDALAPTVINVARQIFIPFFQNLQNLVNTNSESIGAFVAGSISALIKAFVLAARSGLALIQAFQTIRAFLRDSTGAFLQFRLSILETDNAILSFSNSLGITSDAALTAHTKRLDDARRGLDEYAEEAYRADAANEQLNTTLDLVNEGLSDLERLTTGANLGAALPEIVGGPTTAELTANQGDATVDLKEQARLIQLQQQASEDLLDTVRSRRLEELEAINPRLRQIALIDEEIARVSALVAAGADQALAEAEINALIAERANLAGQTDIGQQLSAGITSSLQGAFAASIQDGANFADALADNLEASANQALVDGFESSFQALQDGLGKAFDAVANSLDGVFGGAFEGLGGALGDVLSGALQFVAQQALAAIVGGGGNRSSSSSAGVQSAVTSTQAVRGIVAGPQEIAIAQVDRAIGDAFKPAVAELQTQTGLLRLLVSIVQSSGGVSAGGGGDTTADALAFGSAPAATV